MAKIKLSNTKVEQIKAICKEFNNNKGELINVLHKTQGVFGYLPAEVQEVIAEELGVSVAQVYGVVSFIHFSLWFRRANIPLVYVWEQHATSVVRKRC